MESWKTSIAGVSAALVAFLTLILNPIIDNDPATIPNYNIAIPLICSGLIGIFAKDHKKEDNKNA